MNFGTSGTGGRIEKAGRIETSGTSGTSGAGGTSGRIFLFLWFIICNL